MIMKRNITYENILKKKSEFKKWKRVKILKIFQVFSKKFIFFNTDSSPFNIFEEKDSSEENEQALIKRFNSKLSLILMTLNPKNELVYPDEDLLESGLLFAILLKKFSNMLTNPRVDNLILTEIWLQI